MLGLLKRQFPRSFGDRRSLRIKHNKLAKQNDICSASFFTFPHPEALACSNLVLKPWVPVLGATPCRVLALQFATATHCPSTLHVAAASVCLASFFAAGVLPYSYIAVSFQLPSHLHFHPLLPVATFSSWWPDLVRSFLPHFSTFWPPRCPAIPSCASLPPTLDHHQDDGRPFTMSRQSRNQGPTTPSTTTRQNEYFVPRDGIDREVISADICRYLGNDALVRPGHYEVRNVIFDWPNIWSLCVVILCSLSKSYKLILLFCCRILKMARLFRVTILPRIET